MVLVRSGVDPAFHPRIMTTIDGTFIEQTYAERLRAGWMSAWPDALAFVATLVMAWRGRWAATDLVWSLWLSSLVVGYAIIVWTLVRWGIEIAHAAAARRAQLSAGEVAKVGSILLVLGLVVLAFFTVHFGGFHYVHSQFLVSYFPVTAANARYGGAGWATYVTVARRYWRFLPAAFLAERGAFFTAKTPLPASPVTSSARSFAKSLPTSSATSSATSSDTLSATRGGLMSEPYRNVLRMHALIFFFAFAHFARLDNFVVYAVVYATYFFPWRLVRRPSATTETEAVAA